jgi:hypothetical protein
MIVLLSGEGASDIGSDGGDATVPCRPECFTPGPMAHLLAQLINRALTQSGLEDAISFHADAVVPVRMMSKGNVSSYPAPPSRLRLRAHDEPKDSLPYKIWAAKLTSCGAELCASERDDVLVVLFHDADGTNTSARSMWGDKYKMMCRGFSLAAQHHEHLERRVCGVAMLAKPKSEAWLLCALRPPAYQHCAALEDEPGNDASPRSLKAQLMEALGVEGDPTPVVLERLGAGALDASRIVMPSFNQLRCDLRAALERLGYRVEPGSLGAETPLLQHAEER